MGRSFYRAVPENMVEDFRRRNTYVHRPSERIYTMIERGGRYYQRRHQIGHDGKEISVMEREIHYVIGSGNHARSYLHRTPDGRVYELPVAWYAENGGYWAMNPGYDYPAHDDFRRRVTSQCLFCHNAYPKPDPARDSAAAEPLFDSFPEGIDCQRCHGPGSNHIAAAQDARRPVEEVRAAIVNPARLDARRRMEVCLQCHLETTSFVLPGSLGRLDRGVFSYRPGEPLENHVLHFDHGPDPRFDDKFEIAHHGYRLRKSACFVKSEGRLQCTSCHDPHQGARAREAAARYVRACRSCHGAAFEARVAAGKHTADARCVSCHMPKRRTEDVVHAVMTDHLIRRNPLPGDPLAPLAEKTPEQYTYRGEVRLYYPEDLPGGADRELYLALAQVKDKSNLEAGIPRLEAAIARHQPPQADFLFFLGEALAESGRHEAAAAAYRKAWERESRYWPALHRLGATLARSGQAAEAETVLRQGLAVRPGHSLMMTDLALALLSQGKTGEAADLLRQATRADEFNVEAWNNLGNLLLEQNDIQGAEEALREAVRVQPDHAASRMNLARLLTARQKWAEAKFHFEKAIATQPAFAQAWYNYGVFFAMQGDFASARAQFEKAAALGDPTVRQAAIEGLARIGAGR